MVKQLYIWSSIGFMIRFMIPQFLGICALVYLWDHVDARGSFFTDAGAPIGSASLEALPTFLGQILPAGLIGLIGAGMLAAFMSTHDTYLLCWATSLAEDVINPVTGYRMSMPARLLLTRVLIVLIAAFLLIWSLWYELGQDLWDYMTVTGGIYFTGAFAVLGFGIYWSRASTTGAYLALSAGWFMLLGLEPVRHFIGSWFMLQELKPVKDFFETDWHSETVGLVTVVTAVVFMLGGSLVFPDRGSEKSN